MGCEEFQSLVIDLLGDTIKRLCDRACYTSKSIRVTAYADGIAYAVFKIRPVKERYDSLRNCILTKSTPFITVTDAITSECKVVTKLLLYCVPYLVFCCTMTSQENTKSRGLSALDTLWVIMGRLC